MLAGPLVSLVAPQVLSTRARKDVSLADIKVNVCVFLFDCLYINGRSLLQAPLTERRQALYSTVQVCVQSATSTGEQW